MKISVTNFKAIEEICDFPLQKINVLTGANSGGKSSLIHLLLLIKQTLESRSTELPLKLNRPYVSLGKFENILRKTSSTEAFDFSICLESDELSPRLKAMVNIKSREHKTGHSQAAARRISSIIIKARFRKPTDRIVVDMFEISMQGTEIYTFKVERNSHGKSHKITTNSSWLFLDRGDVVSNTDIKTEVIDGVHVSFLTFFPNFIELGRDEYSGSYIIDLVRNSVTKIFSNISYLGPLREEPRDFYYQDDEFIELIGNKGENAAYLLAKHAHEHITFTKFSRKEDNTLQRTVVTGTLAEAVKYWMCDVFGLAKGIEVDTSKGNRYLYTVSLRGLDGSKVPITHVGFGISQIFPVLVECLRKAVDGRIVILEQPEIHLHPTVQSWLFDFILSTSDRTAFLIETHSDHFITRMRLRVAEEEESASIVEKVNLTFVEPQASGVKYMQLSLNAIGSLDYWPNGFFDQYDDDLRALVKAQAKKKRAMK